MVVFRVWFVCLFVFIALNSSCQDTVGIPYDSSGIYKSIYNWKKNGDSESVFIAPIGHDGRIYFQGMKRELSLKDSSTLCTLDSIAEYLKMNPDLAVEVGLHLSIRHSEGFHCHPYMHQSIIDYLINQGVNSDQLIGKSYCDNKPFLTLADSSRFSNKREFFLKDHRVNYRFEFKKLTGIKSSD